MRIRFTFKFERNLQPLHELRLGAFSAQGTSAKFKTQLGRIQRTNASGRAFATRYLIRLRFVGEGRFDGVAVLQRVATTHGLEFPLGSRLPSRRR